RVAPALVDQLFPALVLSLGHVNLLERRRRPSCGAFCPPRLAGLHAPPRLLFSPAHAAAGLFGFRAAAHAAAGLFSLGAAAHAPAGLLLSFLAFLAFLALLLPLGHAVSSFGLVCRYSRPLC